MTRFGRWLQRQHPLIINTVLVFLYPLSILWAIQRALPEGHQDWLMTRRLFFPEDKR